ncbi:MAG: hypothetical protein UY92_C0007G0038 [Candidatus Magasanikbacteria bacterium GW2011_GWA2_56_11]|uniref:DUF2304 domain-containing protein n=1 Tax=Candidatus Magasanikbacteria bacterium GW2011_GWA2_56_11 TaxID=1619044 RepID=A0A0G2BA66_9BACT|nr:MAG: hypothetical protein UY92_C0007G0038 [Candidatus Magasanikbacteria bacterium GW2011_GWA2_56_11]
MVLLFQILFLVFVLFALLTVTRRKRDGLLGPKGMWFWIVFWLAAAVVVMLPNSTQVIAGYLGIGRGADLVLYVSLTVIFFLLFKLHVKIEAVSRDITRVVRQAALDEVKH